MSNPKTTTAGDVIARYQRWKEEGEDLRAEARQAMEAAFRELLTEAVRIAQEYRADFGTPLKPPPPVTAFRYRTGAKPKPKKAAARPEAAHTPEPPAPKPDRKTLGLQKRLETARKKLEAAKAAGAPTRNLEDKVYEIEDELRLAAQ
ncbi:MAG: hypothetical protein M1436_04950 [Acidobacteria bacterium]|nr:hypothetical protein [Acidobacteriota bacterium]